ncbi:hypothetical protein BGZ54_001924 [Gamsiella multidivaricata]|nr:hypothetical protein BGZ54_001924 [Gamsiella multidivaricata]
MGTTLGCKMQDRTQRPGAVAAAAVAQWGKGKGKGNDKDKLEDPSDQPLRVSIKPAVAICYRNSQQTRRLMYKTYDDDHLYKDKTNDEPEYDADNKMPRFSEPRKLIAPTREAMKPTNFQQVTSICTLF